MKKKHERDSWEYYSSYGSACVVFALAVLLLVVCIGTGDWRTVYRPIALFFAAFTFMARANRA